MTTRSAYMVLCCLSLAVAAYALAVYLLMPVGAAVHPDMSPAREAHSNAVRLHVFAATVALAWLYSGGRAWRAIRERDLTDHRRWMIRNFALTFSAVTLRLYLPCGVRGPGVHRDGCAAGHADPSPIHSLLPLKREVAMRTSLALMSVALCTACATGGGDAGAPDPVVAATEAWRAAYDSRDPARITAMYDSDAVLWGTTAKAIAHDPTAIAAYFKAAASRPTARVEFGDQHTRVYGDVGVNSGTYTFSEMRNGQRVARPARYTFVFRNRGGQWRVVAHHSSVVP